MSKKSLVAFVIVLAAVLSGCSAPDSSQAVAQEKDVAAVAETPEYFLLRP